MTKLSESKKRVIQHTAKDLNEFNKAMKIVDESLIEHGSVSKAKQAIEEMKAANVDDENAYDEYALATLILHGQDRI